MPLLDSVLPDLIGCESGPFSLPFRSTRSDRRTFSDEFLQIGIKVSSTSRKGLTACRLEFIVWFGLVFFLAIAIDFFGWCVFLGILSGSRPPRTLKSGGVVVFQLVFPLGTDVPIVADGRYGRKNANNATHRAAGESPGWFPWVFLVGSFVETTKPLFVVKKEMRSVAKDRRATSSNRIRDNFMEFQSFRNIVQRSHRKSTNSIIFLPCVTSRSKMVDFFSNSFQNVDYFTTKFAAGVGGELGHFPYENSPLDWSIYIQCKPCGVQKITKILSVSFQLHTFFKPKFT